MSDKRPEIPALKVGDTLTAIPSRGANYEVTVTKIGRKWGYAVRTEHYGSAYGQTDIKFDLKDGWLDGGNYTSPGRLLTQAQLDWHERESRATEYIKTHLTRHTFDLKPQWRDDLVELANILRRHEGLEEL